MNFICPACAGGAHGPCKERNKDKYTRDCDCLHRTPSK